MRRWLAISPNPNLKLRSTRSFWRTGAFVSVAFAVVLLFDQAMAQTHSPARDINDVLRAHDKELLAIPGVVGVYVAVLEDGKTPCLKVMLAQNIGKLSLILRQPGENEAKIARRVNESDLGIAEVQLAPAPAAVSASRPSTNNTTVEIVRGLKGEKYDVVRTQ